MTRSRPWFANDIQGFVPTDKTRPDKKSSHRQFSQPRNRLPPFQQIVYQGNFNFFHFNTQHSTLILFSLIFIIERSTTGNCLRNTSATKWHLTEDTSTVRYVPQPGGRSSPNNAPDVDIRVIISPHFCVQLQNYDNRVTASGYCTTVASPSTLPNPFSSLCRWRNSTGNARTDAWQIASIFWWSWPTWIRFWSRPHTRRAPLKPRMTCKFIDSLLPAKLPNSSIFDLHVGYLKCRSTLPKSATLGRLVLTPSSSALLCGATRVSRAKIVRFPPPRLRWTFLFMQSTNSNICHWWNKICFSFSL